MLGTKVDPGVHRLVSNRPVLTVPLENLEGTCRALGRSPVLSGLGVLTGSQGQVETEKVILVSEMTARTRV